MLRLSLLSGLAAVALFTAPAMADGLKVGGFALSNQNIGSVNNTAAGVNNFAGQKVTGVQVGSPTGFAKPGFGFGGANSNVGSVNNLAAGVGNTAVQSVTGIQSGFGKGGFANSNLGTINNTAAGVGNTAVQSVTGIQAR
jgi:hypothetical protein